MEESYDKLIALKTKCELQGFKGLLSYQSIFFWSKLLLWIFLIGSHIMMRRLNFREAIEKEISQLITDATYTWPCCTNSCLPTHCFPQLPWSEHPGAPKPLAKRRKSRSVLSITFCVFLSNWWSILTYQFPTSISTITCEECKSGVEKETSWRGIY